MQMLGGRAWSSEKRFGAKVQTPKIPAAPRLSSDGGDEPVGAQSLLNRSPRLSPPSPLSECSSFFSTVYSTNKASGRCFNGGKFVSICF